MELELFTRELDRHQAEEFTYGCSQRLLDYWEDTCQGGTGPRDLLTAAATGHDVRLEQLWDIGGGHFDWYGPRKRATFQVFHLTISVLTGPTYFTHDTRPGTTAAAPVRAGDAPEGQWRHLAALHGISADLHLVFGDLASTWDGDLDDLLEYCGRLSHQPGGHVPA